VARGVPELSGDYPAEAMRRLGAGRGPALLLQGAGGDARPPGIGVEAIAASAARVATGAEEALAAGRAAPDRLAYAEVEIALPAAEPQGVRSRLGRRVAGNLLALAAPTSARVTVLAVGDVLLLGVPGEPTALAASRIVGALPPASIAGRRVRVVGLAQGYVGYVDTPERVRDGQGEARRAWFGPALLETVARGLSAGVAAIESPQPQSTTTTVRSSAAMPPVQRRVVSTIRPAIPAASSAPAATTVSFTRSRPKNSPAALAASTRPSV
jgi:hypothetical protein